MRARIAVLPGDGAGPELAREAVACLRGVGRLFGHSFTFLGQPSAAITRRPYGMPLLPTSLRACMDADAVLAGAEAGLHGLPAALGACARLMPAGPDRTGHTSGRWRPHLRVVLDPAEGGGAPQRLARFALEMARDRRLLTVVTETPRPARSDRLVAAVAAIAPAFPRVAVDRRSAQACAAALGSDRDRFRVLLVEPEAEPILLPRLAALSGGPGLLGGAWLGGVVGLYAPLGTALPTGPDRADPAGAVVSAALLLRHSLGLEAEAAALEAAVAGALAQGYGTPDLPGQARPVGTRGMGEAIRRNLARGRISRASA